MSVKIVYEDLAVGADEAATVMSGDAQALSDLAELPFGLTAGKVATGEQGGWILSRSYRLFRTQKAAFWSTAMSGSDGRFSTAPTITITFDGVFTSLGIALVFDEPTNDWCNEVELTWYRGSTVLHHQTFYPDSVTYFCEATVESYDKIVIAINATKLPYRYARLSRVIFGIERVFNQAELRKVHLIQQVNLISDEVSVNTMDFSLNSLSGLDYIFQTRQPLLAYDDDSLVGVFYIKSAKQRTGNLYDIDSQDAIGVLDEEKISAKMYNAAPLEDALAEIIGDAFEVDIDTALSGATVTGYVPAGTRRQALHVVAFGAMALVDTSGTDKIRVFPARNSNPSVIPQNRIYVGGNVETETPLTTIRVMAHSYSTTGSGSDTIEVDGVTYYHTATVTEIDNPLVSALDKRRVVEISSATTVTPANVSAIAQMVFDYYMRYNKHTAKIVMQGERPGDYVSTVVPWLDTVTGNITRMDITLSGFAAAEIEVIGS